MSTIKSKEDLAYVVKVDDIFPLVNNAGDIPVSVTPDQIGKAILEYNKDAAHAPDVDTEFALLMTAAGELKAVVLTKAGAVEKDVDGNILAQVNHRKDTLVNLLALADAGDGEIAVASDVNALVVYDALSNGRIYRPGGIIEKSRYSLSGLAIPTAAWTVLPLVHEAGRDLTSGQSVDLSNIEYWKDQPNGVVDYHIHGRVRSGGWGVGTVVQVRPALWVVTPASFPLDPDYVATATADGAGEIVLDFDFKVVDPTALALWGGALFTHLAIELMHDAGVDVNLIGDVFEVVFEWSEYGSFE